MAGPAVLADASKPDPSTFESGLQAVLQHALLIQAQQEQLQRTQSELLSLALRALSAKASGDPSPANVAAVAGGSAQQRPAWLSSPRSGLATAEGRTSDQQRSDDEPEIVLGDPQEPPSEAVSPATVQVVKLGEDAAPSAPGTIPAAVDLLGELERLRRHATEALHLTNNRAISHRHNVVPTNGRTSAPDVSIALRQAAYVVASTAQGQAHGLMQARARIQDRLALQAATGRYPKNVAVGHNQAHTSSASGAPASHASVNASVTERQQTNNWKEVILKGCGTVAELLHGANQARRTIDCRESRAASSESHSHRCFSVSCKSRSAGLDAGSAKHRSRSACSSLSTLDISKPSMSSSRDGSSEALGLAMHPGLLQQQSAFDAADEVDDSAKRPEKMTAGDLTIPNTDARTDLERSSNAGSRVSHVLFGVLTMDGSPDATIRGLWDCFVLLLMFLVLMIVPYTVAFEHTSAIDEDGAISGWFCVLLFVDLCFVLDMYQQCRMTYLDDDDVEVTSRWKIILHYLTSWFLFDAISVLPFDQMLESQSSRLLTLSKSAKMARLAKVLRVVKVLKMLRLLRASDLISRVQATIGRPMSSLLKIMGLAGLLLHSVACMFHFFAIVAPPPEEDYEEVFGRSTWLHANDLVDRSEGERYLMALYWAFGTLSTVAYGDITPMSMIEIIFSMIVMALGLSVFSYFFASVSQVVKSLNAAQNKVTNVMENVDMLLDSHHVPSLLAKRIRDYFQYCAEHNMMASDFSMLQHLTGQLHQDIQIFMFDDLFTSVPFLANKGPAFVLELVQVLTMKVFAPDEFVIIEGDVCTSMYFISDGEIDQLKAKDKAVFTREVLKARHKLVQRREPNTKRQRFVAQASRMRSTFGVKKPRAKPWLQWFRREREKQPTRVLDIVPKHLYDVVPPMLGPGDHFGEQGCMVADKRAPTSFTTRTFVKVLELGVSDLEDLVALFGDDVDFDWADSEEAGSGSETVSTQTSSSDEAIPTRPTCINWGVNSVAGDRTPAGRSQAETHKTTSFNTLSEAMTTMRMSALSKGSNILLSEARSQHETRLLQPSGQSTPTRSQMSSFARKSGHNSRNARSSLRRKKICSETALLRLMSVKRPSWRRKSTTTDEKVSEVGSSASGTGDAAETRSQSASSDANMVAEPIVEERSRRRRMSTGSFLSSDEPTYAGIDGAGVKERLVASLQSL